MASDSQAVASAAARCARLASLAVLLTMSCRSAAPQSSGGVPSPAPSALSSRDLADAAASPVAETRADAGTDAGPSAARALDATDASGATDTLIDRRTFRHVSVGLILSRAHRATWILSRRAKSAQLEVRCESAAPPAGKPGIRLDGAEADDALWSPDGSTDYAGSPAAEPLAYRFTASTPVSGRPACAQFPSTLVLRCRKDRVAVLRAGAKLIPPLPGASDASRAGPARWEPKATQQLEGLRCELAGDAGGGAGIPWLWPDWALFFTEPTPSAPGVEWAHENSDMQVQQGAYRRMPRL